jgi:hypothetical protein
MAHRDASTSNVPDVECLQHVTSTDMATSSLCNRNSLNGKGMHIEVRWSPPVEHSAIVGHMRRVRKCTDS